MHIYIRERSSTQRVYSMPPEKKKEKRGGSIQTPHKKRWKILFHVLLYPHTHDVGSGGAALTVDDDELYFCPQPKKRGGNVLLLSY